MAALYDLFRTPQPKGDEKVRYHARSVVTGKMTTRDLIQDIARRSAFKEGVVTGVLISLEEALKDALAKERVCNWMASVLSASVPSLLRFTTGMKSVPRASSSREWCIRPIPSC